VSPDPAGKPGLEAGSTAWVQRVAASWCIRSDSGYNRFLEAGADVNMRHGV
jgi:hypothetical protein